MAVTIRANNVKASNLIFLAYGLIALTLFIQIPPTYEKLLATKSPAMLWASVFFVVAYLVGISIGVRRGYRWVKIFFAFFTMWDIIRYILDFPPTDGITLRTAMFFVATIAKAWAAFIVAKDLLHRPATEDAGAAHGQP